MWILQYIHQKNCITLKINVEYNIIKRGEISEVIQSKTDAPKIYYIGVAFVNLSDTVGFVFIAHNKACLPSTPKQLPRLSPTCEGANVLTLE